MRLVTQLQKHNEKQIQNALREGKREHDKSHPSLHEAAVIAGEFIAAKNKNGSIKLEEVIKSHKPDYLTRRGVV